MALDMLLVEKGGVCKMFGDSCCTFIPNNTASDGSITRALQGLTSLAEELAENSGIESPFGFLNGILSKWKTLFLSMFTSLIVVVAMMILCGFCCIPCIRGLIQRAIDRALNKPDTMYMCIQRADDDYDGSNDDVNPKDNNTDSYV